jgi:hypothetical protein
LWRKRLWNYWTESQEIGYDDDDDDGQWRYSPDRALASLYGFHDSFYSTMWGYQLHDRRILDTLIQLSETSSSNYQRLSRRSRETRVRNGRWILPTSPYRARRVLLHAVNLRHGKIRYEFHIIETWLQKEESIVHFVWSYIRIKFYFLLGTKVLIWCKFGLVCGIFVSVTFHC